MTRRFIALLGTVILLGGVVLGFVWRDLSNARRQLQHEVLLAAKAATSIRADNLSYSWQRIATGSTLGRTLAAMGIEPAMAADIVHSAQGVFDLRLIQAGHRLEIGRSPEGQLRAVRYQIDADHNLAVQPASSGFQAEVQPIPSRESRITVSGEVRDSLSNAIAEAGEQPELAMRLADIFGWDLDFYTDPRRGDTFRVLIEKRNYPDGQQSYGRILAAEYDNDGRVYKAVLFHNAAGAAAYFSPDGKSLQKAFLRSPLKFAAPITSHFSSSRLHPILMRQLPHLGVDYAAPAGTPVQAIGDGRVIFAANKGGAGNMVEIQHANGYQTMYLHLSAILVREGQHVEAGGRIGLVGSTGLATGPHLDFRIVDHGVFRNFETLRLDLPSAEPVADGDFAAFNAVRDLDLLQLKDTALESRTTEPDPAANPSASR